MIYSLELSSSKEMGPPVTNSQADDSRSAAGKQELILYFLIESTVAVRLLQAREQIGDAQSRRSPGKARALTY
jgi:hypothetical protein